MCVATYKQTQRDESAFSGSQMTLWPHCGISSAMASITSVYNQQRSYCKHTTSKQQINPSNSVPRTRLFARVGTPKWSRMESWFEIRIPNNRPNKMLRDAPKFMFFLGAKDLTHGRPSGRLTGMSAWVQFLDSKCTDSRCTAFHVV